MIYLRLVIIIILFQLCISCRYPKDPSETLNNIKTKQLIIVGYCINPPWVIANEPPSGIEPSIIKMLANKLNVKIQWIKNTESNLVTLLENKQINIMICGLKEDSIWKTKVTFTKSYIKNNKIKRVLGVLKGENDWLSTVDKFLEANKININTVVKHNEQH